MIFYRILVTVLSPILLIALTFRVLRGRETLSDLSQRLGGGKGVAGAIWLHAASNGELTSAKPLTRSILTTFPDYPLVVTCNTTTGRALVESWQMPGVSTRLAPLDYRPVLARFRAHWQPKALIILENELWPNRILTAREPVICVAARMSARSAARWARLGGIARHILTRINWLSAQDDASSTRFATLGLPPASLGPVISLKPSAELAPPGAELEALSRIFGRADTLLAASTHDGEDAVLLDSFIAARPLNPSLKLILAPRHPNRASQITTLIRRAGLTYSTRSENEPVSQKTDVYLADTLGEMALWYALAGVTFVGGSLVDKGGHTPFEPAQAGSVILHGPHVANFAQAYAALDRAGAGICVRDAAGIAAALSTLGNATAQQAIASKARDVLAPPNTESTQPIITALRAALSAH